MTRYRDPSANLVANELLPRVTEVRHVRDHILWLRFADGVAGEVDLANELRGGLLEPLRDPDAFARVSVRDGTIVWPNGADWAPETLHERVAAAEGISLRSIGDVQRASLAYIAGMPEISRFFGIVIRMLADDHAPPHFHATHGDHAISVTIADGLVTGRFPKRALRLVLEWHDLHQAELAENWERLQSGRPVEPIPPLA